MHTEIPQCDGIVSLPSALNRVSHSNKINGKQEKKTNLGGIFVYHRPLLDVEKSE